MELQIDRQPAWMLEQIFVNDINNRMCYTQIMTSTSTKLKELELLLREERERRASAQLEAQLRAAEKAGEMLLRARELAARGAEGEI